MTLLVHRHLTAACPILGRHIERVGPLPWPKPAGTDLYEALISAVAHQQLHARAATTILGRLAALNHGALPRPAELLVLSDEAIRGCGFSRGKMAALRDIAARTADGTVPSAGQARRLSNAALIERLINIRGVGQWTVEMLLIFTLKRPDVFPVDDFGVREGYKLLYGCQCLVGFRVSAGSDTRSPAAPRRSPPGLPTSRRRHSRHGRSPSRPAEFHCSPRTNRAAPPAHAAG
jgi:DNA-3-methyladenine glycosylase II